jgi:DNA-binding phage protein
MPKKARRPRQMVNILRDAIRKSGMTHYAIARETGLSAGNLDRFMRSEYEDMRLSSVQKLADLLGLELRPIDETGDEAC